MYSPKIDEGLIPTLYRLAKERKVPMTRLVNEMLRSALGESGEAPLGEIESQVGGPSSS